MRGPGFPGEAARARRRLGSRGPAPMPGRSAGARRCYVKSTGFPRAGPRIRTRPKAGPACSRPAIPGGTLSRDASQAAARSGSVFLTWRPLSQAARGNGQDAPREAAGVGLGHPDKRPAFMPNSADRDSAVGGGGEGRQSRLRRPRRPGRSFRRHHTPGNGAHSANKERPKGTSFAQSPAMRHPAPCLDVGAALQSSSGVGGP